MEDVVGVLIAHPDSVGDLAYGQPAEAAKRPNFL
jgi:hypothetical protein